ncbi:MAG: hypothetical protein L0Y58_17570 [Verrucomicrobia subdivision 3 bacterium]|nr:hypothetical protein [Limisphaerales bacterium]
MKTNEFDGFSSWVLGTSAFLRPSTLAPRTLEKLHHFYTISSPNFDACDEKPQQNQPFSQIGLCFGEIFVPTIPSTAGLKGGVAGSSISQSTNPRVRKLQLCAVAPLLFTSKLDISGRFWTKKGEGVCRFAHLTARSKLTKTDQN